jgi:hypothetical protein
MTSITDYYMSQTREQDPPHNATAMFCRIRYWRQNVTATIDRSTKMPLKAVPFGDKQPLPLDIFNTTMFERLLSTQQLEHESRGDVLPSRSIPTYQEAIAGTNLTLTPAIQPMVGLALATASRSQDDYLNPQNLTEAYTAAYQLLFARAMVDVLGNNTSRKTQGEQRVKTEAIVLEPVFVYIVGGFLGVVSIATIALLALTLTMKRNLKFNPSTIASVMAIVADNAPLLLDLQDLDCCTTEDMEKVLGSKRYKLVSDGGGTR